MLGNSSPRTRGGEKFEYFLRLDNIGFRYQQDGFDLDLTYVTNRVIATSFPSTGVWSLYRFELYENVVILSIVYFVLSTVHWISFTVQ